MSKPVLERPKDAGPAHMVRVDLRGYRTYQVNLYDEDGRQIVRCKRIAVTWDVEDQPHPVATLEFSDGSPTYKAWAVLAGELPQRVSCPIGPVPQA